MKHHWFLFLFFLVKVSPTPTDGIETRQYEQPETHRLYLSKPSFRSNDTNSPKSPTSAEETSTKQKDMELDDIYFHRSDEDHKISKGTQLTKRPSFHRAKSSHFIKRVYSLKELPFTGSLTPYEVGVNISKLPEKVIPNACRVVRIWSLFRHGIRYPGEEAILGMRYRLKNLQDAIILKQREFKKQNLNTESCYSDELRDWVLLDDLNKDLITVSNDLLNQNEEKEVEKKKKGEGEDIANSKSLTKEGEEEIISIANRFQEKFDRVFINAKTRNSLLFKFTETDRTRDSAKKFYEGLFNEKPTGDWHAPILKGKEGKDPLLKFDAVCNHWKKNYKKSSFNEFDFDSFKNGEEVQSAIKGIQTRCKFPEESFTYSDIKLLYETCAFYVAWKKKSPWCDLLTPQYQEVFEYIEDFEFYKNDGPENNVNREIGCFVFKDMVDRLIGDVVEINGTIVYEINEKAFEDKDSKTKIATIYFTHLTAILKFMTHLGLYDEHESLRRDNFEQMKTRYWKTSRIGCFGTNITFVLLKCFFDGKDDYYVQLLHQEQPTLLPKCGSRSHGYLCPLDIFLEVYSDNIFKCRYKELCEEKKEKYLQSWQRFSSDKSFKKNTQQKTIEL